MRRWTLRRTSRPDLDSTATRALHSPVYLHIRNWPHSPAPQSRRSNRDPVAAYGASLPKQRSFASLTSWQLIEDGQHGGTGNTQQRHHVDYAMADLLHLIHAYPLGHAPRIRSKGHGCDGCLGHLGPALTGYSLMCSSFGVTKINQMRCLRPSSGAKVGVEDRETIGRLWTLDSGSCFQA